MSVFKACDIRGIAEKDLTDDVATQIAKAVGVKLSGKRIVVGNDVRLSSPRLKEIAVRELAASGCEVVDIGTSSNANVLLLQQNIAMLLVG